MVLLAKTEPGGAAGLVWEKAGDEGAIEVHPRLANELLAIPGELFYVVKKEVKKVEKAIEAEVEKIVAKKSPAKAATEEVNTSADLSEAIDTASSTKRRSTKE
jgi:hypothetical protein